MSGRHGGDQGEGSPNYGTQAEDCSVISPKKHVIPYRFMSYGLCFLLIVGACVVAIYLSLKYSSVGNSPKFSGVWYSPNDSHVLPVSGIFCQNFYVWTHNGAHDYNISMVMLNSKPKLDGNDHFSFSERIVFDEEYQNYFYYLYQGSSVSVSACNLDSDGHGVVFSLLKGNETYQRVKNGFPNISKSDSETWLQVDSYCGSGMNQVTHTISTSEFYFFLFFHQKNSGSSNSVNISLSVNRTKYVSDSDSSSTHCISDSVISGSNESCSTSVPLNVHYTLLKLEPNEYNSGVEWAGDKELLSTKCDSRLWMYILLSFAVALGIVLILLISILFCMAATRYHKKRVHHPALYEHLATNYSTSSDSQSESSYSASLKCVKFCLGLTRK